MSNRESNRHSGEANRINSENILREVLFSSLPAQSITQINPDGAAAPSQSPSRVSVSSPKKINPYLFKGGSSLQKQLLIYGVLPSQVQVMSTSGYRNIPRLDNASSVGNSNENVVLAQRNKLNGPSGHTLDSHYRKRNSIKRLDVSVTQEPSTTIDDEGHQEKTH